MQKQRSLLALGSITLGSLLAGCKSDSMQNKFFQKQNPAPVAPVQLFADSNTQPIGRSDYTVSFLPVVVDSLRADGRSFPLVPRDLSKDIHYDGKNIPNVLEDQFVPEDNSDIIRTPTTFDVLPRTEKYPLANGFFNDEGELLINHEAEPKSSFYVLWKKEMSRPLTETESEAIKTSIYQGLTKDAPAATIRGIRYATTTINNTYGPDRVLLNTRGIDPKIFTQNFYDETTGDTNTIVRAGVTTVGYIPIKGLEVERPLPPAPEGPKPATVIEGMPDPAIR